MKHLSYVMLAAMLIMAGCASSYYHAGNRAYNQMAYKEAAVKLEKSLDLKPSGKWWTNDAKRKLADSYRKMRNTAEAEKWYKEVSDLPDATAAERMRTAQVMMSNGNYSEAKIQLRQYLDQVPNDQAAQKLYASLDSIAAWKADSTSFKIESASINSGQSNLSTSYFKDGVIFSSDRDGKKTYAWTGRPFLDMYYAKENSPGQFDKPVKLKGKINGLYHDGPGWATADGKTIYFTRNNVSGAKARRSKNDDVVNLKIYQATLVGDEWSDIKELPFNSNEYSCGHPTLSLDGTTMYFVSDMPGGHGGTDIYMVKRRGDEWGPAQNVGTVINTPFNEMFPTVNNTMHGEELFFSSEGHYNMGGLDIFRTKMENGAWSTPVNVGYPLNTSKDDFGMIVRGDTTGYLSSNRVSADGLIDNVLRFKQAEIFFNLDVLAVNKSENMAPLPGTNVELLNKRTGEKETSVTGQDGKTRFKLRQNTDYTVLGSKEGFFSNSAEVSTVGKTVSEDMNITLVLEMEVMQLNQPVALKNIYYDFDKANIRPDAAVELDRLVKIMNDNPNILVELASHTDSRGSHAYNQRLSQRRADAAVKYIVTKGVEKKRITAKGYGETKLLNNCKDGVKCSEAEHQLNRRTEFTVTGFSQPVKSSQ